MIESFLITSRETLELALIVGIVLAYLNRTNNKLYKKNVYFGLGSGILVSIILALIFTKFAGGFEGVTEELFEGITMLVGAALLTTMIFWMMNQRKIFQTIHGRVDKHISKDNFSSHLGIFAIIFVAVLREGVETVIFLNAIKYAGGTSLLGGFLGIIVAIIIGYLFFSTMKKINLKKLFNISSILLILFAAGLVAHGVHELEEAKVIDGIIYPLYDINPEINEDGSYPALHEKGSIGSFLKGLFGYNGNPSLLEVIMYISYLIFVYIIYLRKKLAVAKNIINEQQKSQT